MAHQFQGDAQLSKAEDAFLYTAPEHLLRDFVSRGLVVLAPESLGIPRETHDRVYAAERQAFSAKRRITAALIPEMLDVLAAPGLVAACDRLLGPDWAIVPFTHNTPFVSGSYDQHWHKDDTGPYNLRKARHHQAVQVEMLYYPQEVRADMGPTATIPYSQYWTFNHEENHDNFAGADHLDFAYKIEGMESKEVSGPRSQYDPEDIVAAHTEHDVRMREAVKNTGWPLVAPFEAYPLRAGSVILYSHNLFHRGTHRRDNWRTWKENPRFMWRFWLYRTNEPQVTEEADADWTEGGVDELTGVDRGAAPTAATTVWRQQYAWMAGREQESSDATAEKRHELKAALSAPGEEMEPTRIGAAYQLAAWVRKVSMCSKKV